MNKCIYLQQTVNEQMKVNKLFVWIYVFIFLMQRNSLQKCNIHRQLILNKNKKKMNFNEMWWTNKTDRRAQQKMTRICLNKQTHMFNSQHKKVVVVWGVEFFSRY